jgi:hypothetical protein
MKIVGLHSRAHGGKDTVAEHLVRRHGFVQIAFADAVYAGLAAMFDVSVDMLRAHSFKERDSTCLGDRSPRYLLQTLGTDWGRDMVHRDVWVRIAAAKLERHRATNCAGVVLSDVRHDNEADFVRDSGGQIWIIVRPTKKPDYVRPHSSEAGITQHGRDRGLLNDGTLEQLEARVDLLVQQLESQGSIA